MKIEVKVPEVGESISEVVIGQWLKQNGDWVKEDEPLCEIESEKATFEVPAEAAGQLTILAQEGETVAVGQVIATIDTEAQPAAKESPAAEQATAEAAPATTEKSERPAAEVPQEAASTAAPKVSPVAARILADAGIAPESVTGTGLGGKITKEDALRAVAAQKSAPTPEVPPKQETPAATEPSTTPTGERPIRRVRMSNLRKTIAKRLVTAKQETAMLTTFNEVDMSAIMAIRKQYKEVFQQKFGIKLGFMSFFTKACAQALLEFPEVNAAIEGDEIVYHDYCDIGIAVSTDRGLVVPVVRNAEKLTLAEIEKEIARLAERARSNKLTIDEMTGGTFTITNGGVFGSLLSTPIINYPQSAILGMHKIQERPVVINGEIVVRPMMYVALSYDHRIIDGRESVSFLVRVKEMLEDPTRMLLHV